MVDKILPDDLEDPGRVFPTEKVGTGEKESLRTASATQPFSSFMQKGVASPMENAGKASNISPFAMMQGQAPTVGAPNMGNLLSQVNNVQSTLGDIKTQLDTPKLKLKASTKYLVKNKLTDANENLRSFNTKIGANVPAEPDATQFKGPLGRFFAYVQDGQAQMEQAKMQLQNLKDKGENISPGDFLLVQVKLAKAQQLLEFSSVLLSNAVSGIKQMMQIQL
jgi:hypothetical protein